MELGIANAHCSDLLIARGRDIAFRSCGHVFLEDSDVFWIAGLGELPWLEHGLEDVELIVLAFAHRHQGSFSELLSSFFCKAIHFILIGLPAGDIRAVHKGPFQIGVVISAQDSM